MKFVQLHSVVDNSIFYLNMQNVEEMVWIATSDADAYTAIKMMNDADYYCKETTVEILQKIADDAVPVIRCKNCKHFMPENELSGSRCAKLFRMANPNDYCSFGKRKEKTEC